MVKSHPDNDPAVPTINWNLPDGSACRIWRKKYPAAAVEHPVLFWDHPKYYFERGERSICLQKLKTVS